MTDPRQYEIRVSWVGGGPIVVRGRLAWLIFKLVTRGGAELAEDLDRLHNGHLEVDWTDRGTARVETQRSYHWPGEVT